MRFHGSIRVPSHLVSGSAATAFCCTEEATFLVSAAATAAKLLQSCPTLCDPIDGSPSGSPIPGILQARTLEWVAISFSNAWKGKMKWSRSVVSDSSRPHELQPTRLFCPWDFPGESTGVGCHCLLFTCYCCIIREGLRLGEVTKIQINILIQYFLKSKITEKNPWWTKYQNV